MALMYKPTHIYIYYIYSIYYYLNHPYSVKRKALKILKPNMPMCTGLSFVIRFYNNVTNRNSKTAKNDS